MESASRDESAWRDWAFVGPLQVADHQLHLSGPLVAGGLGLMARNKYRANLLVSTGGSNTMARRPTNPPFARLLKKVSVGDYDI